MSKHREELITCPSCGESSKFLIWESVNTVIDPEMKEKVRSREVFQFTCPQCGTKTMVNYDCLYHQMEDKVMIYLVPGDMADAELMMKGYIRDEAGNIIENPYEKEMDMDDYRKRVVGSMNDFMEKLYILDAGYDDRIIELMKVFMISQLQEQKEFSYEEFLFAQNRDGSYGFHVNQGNDKWGNVDFIPELYEQVKEIFLPVVEEAEQEVIIDLAWAVSVLKNQT